MLQLGLTFLESFDDYTIPDGCELYLDIGDFIFPITDEQVYQHLKELYDGKPVELYIGEKQ